MSCAANRHTRCPSGLVFASILLVLALLSIPGTSQARAGQVIINTTQNVTYNNTFASFLGIYVSNSVINTSTFTNLTLKANSSKTYVLMTQRSGGYVLINTTGSGYSFVENASTAFAVMQPYLVTKFYPKQSEFSSLSSNMTTYFKTGDGPIFACFNETGLNQYMCSSSDTINYCLERTCDSVPVCRDLLKAPGPYNISIYNLSLQWRSLNASYNTFTSTAGSINQGNIGSSLTELGSLISGISQTVTAIPHSALFSAPSNLSTNYLQQVCPSYVPPAGPWWCYAQGFCPNPTFNSVLLGKINAQVQSLEALPITNASITVVARQTVANGADYFEPIDVANDTSQYNAFLNATMPAYNSILANLTFVSGRYKNQTLANALAVFEAGYQGYANGGIEQNFTSASSGFALLAANASKAYKTTAAPYLSAYDQAVNNTALILITELDYAPGTVPYSVISLADQETVINQELLTQVNTTQLKSITAQMSSISSQAKSLSSPLSLAALEKTTKGPILTSLLAGSGANPQSNIALAVLYSPLITLLVGALVVIVIYWFTYRKLKTRHKLNMTPRARRAWTILFSILALLVLVATGITYSYANQANQFLPVSLFLGNVKSSGSVVVFLNSSIANNASLGQCLTSLNITLHSQKKNMTTLKESNYACTSTIAGNLTGTKCFDRIVASGLPVIMVTSLANGSITHKGLYGNILYVNGTAAEGAACPLAAIIRVGG